VYKAKSLKTNEHLALKRIFPIIQANYIYLEILFLKLVSPLNNVIKLLYGVRKDSLVSLAFPYIEYVNFFQFVETNEIKEVKRYMFQLLNALVGLESLKIMHRDVKHSNFLYSTKSHRGYLIDFGLSEIVAGQNKSSDFKDNIRGEILTIQAVLSIKHRKGTRGYMAPEILFKSAVQSYASDMWAAGIIFLSLLAKRHPVISINCKDKNKNKKDILQQLLPLMYIYGSNIVVEAAFKYGFGLYVPPDFPNKNPMDVSIFIKREDAKIEGLDLLKQMLSFNPDQRIKAIDARNHKFFDEIRDEFATILNK